MESEAYEIFEVLEHVQPHNMGWDDAWKSHGLYASQKGAEQKVIELAHPPESPNSIFATRIVKRLVNP